MFFSEELADIHYIYGSCDGNSAAARIEYQRRFPNRRVPSVPIFRNMHSRFREGTLFQQPQSSSQPTRRTISVEMEERVLALVDQIPSASTRSIGRQLGMSHVTVWTILHNAGKYPYHTLQVQELLPRDKISRVEFDFVI